MMNTQATASTTTAKAASTGLSSPALTFAGLGLIAVILVPLYRQAAYELYDAWTLIDGYYSHGPFVPLISLFFVWRLLPRLKAAAPSSSAWGYVFILGAGLLLIIGDFLGFRVFTEFSMLPMLLGLCLLFLGIARTRVLWFPLVFLIFMIPIPSSVTQSLALNLKLFAAEASVQLANLLTLPMVREGSFIYFKQEHLIIGEVCGGLRSLIALLAFGAIMAYISKAKPGARIFLFATAPLIAMIANIVRIFFLCVVGYFYGSNVAAGTVHDVSGVGIFVVAFILFFTLDSQLRRFFPAKETEPVTEPPQKQPTFGRGTSKAAVITCVILVAFTVLHLNVVDAQAEAVEASKHTAELDIPDYIGRFKRMGQDKDVEEHVMAVLETSQILIRPYEAPNGYPVTLTIVHAGTTRRSLHFPEVCLVGAGWEIRQQSSMPVDLSLTAKQLVLARSDARQAVLYWFKTGDHMTGNYFVNAYHWAYNQVSFGAPTSSLIKLTAPIVGGDEDYAFAMLLDFARSFVGVALDRIP